MQSLTVLKGWQVIFSIITSPYEKKKQPPTTFLIITLCLGSQRQGSLAGVTRGNSVEARIAKKEQEIFFLFYVFIASLKFFWHFLKVNLGDGWGRDFEREREKKNKNNQSFVTNPTLDTEGPSLTPSIF